MKIVLPSPFLDRYVVKEKVGHCVVLLVLCLTCTVLKLYVV